MLDTPLEALAGLFIHLSLILLQTRVVPSFCCLLSTSQVCFRAACLHRCASAVRSAHARGTNNYGEKVECFQFEFLPTRKPKRPLNGFCSGHRGRLKYDPIVLVSVSKILSKTLKIFLTVMSCLLILNTWGWVPFSKTRRPTKAAPYSFTENRRFHKTSNKKTTKVKTLCIYF